MGHKNRGTARPIPGTASGSDEPVPETGVPHHGLSEQGACTINVYANDGGDLVAMLPLIIPVIVPGKCVGAMSRLLSERASVRPTGPLRTRFVPMLTARRPSRAKKTQPSGPAQP